MYAKKTEIDWVPVEEDTPLVGVGYKRVSDFLWIKLSDGSIIEGYYVIDEDEWRDQHSKKIPYEKVVAWSSMETKGRRN